MQRCHDRVKETTTTTGTGDITLLGAVTQFQSFSNAYILNEPLYYAIVGQTGSEWEVGRGHLSATSTLVRDIIFESSNSNTVVSLSAGTKDIFATIPSERIEEIFTKGQVLAAVRGFQLP